MMRFSFCISLCYFVILHFLRKDNAECQLLIIYIFSLQDYISCGCKI